MATKQEIQELVYKYYPKGIAISDAYYSSNEYWAKRQKVDEAYHDKSLQAQWANFKEEFRKRPVKEKSQILADYSFFGGSPAHHISIRAEALDGISDEVIVFTVVISVISAFWAYRFMDRAGAGWKARYSPKDKKEKELIAQVGAIIKETFPHHEPLEEEYLLAGYDDIESSLGLGRPPTVFDLLFVDHDN